LYLGNLKGRDWKKESRGYFDLIKVAGRGMQEITLP
jgi:hypothetical protein